MANTEQDDLITFLMEGGIITITDYKLGRFGGPNLIFSYEDGDNKFSNRIPFRDSGQLALYLGQDGDCGKAALHAITELKGRLAHEQS